MRFYYGNVYAVQGVLRMCKDGMGYIILDTRREKEQRTAYLLCGYGRELRVGEDARLILFENGKEKIIKLPFVKSKEDGRLVLDLQEYFKSKKIPFKVYKRDRGGDCYGTSWMGISHVAEYCKNGNMGWYSRSFDYTVYDFWVNYEKKLLYVESVAVKRITVRNLTNDLDNEEVRRWFEKTYEEKQNLSWREFGKALDELKIPKTYFDFEIEFCDGTTVSGKDVNWE